MDNKNYIISKTAAKAILKHTPHKWSWDKQFKMPDLQCSTCGAWMSNPEIGKVKKITKDDGTIEYQKIDWRKWYLPNKDGVYNIPNSELIDCPKCNGLYNVLCHSKYLPFWLNIRFKISLFLYYKIELPFVKLKTKIENYFYERQNKKC